MQKCQIAFMVPMPQNRNQEAESYLSFRDHRYKRKGGGNAAKKFINEDRSQTIITRKKHLLKSSVKS